MDPAQSPPSGGAEQVITDGCYNADNVTTKDPKYPTPASAAFKKNEHMYYSKNSYATENPADGEQSRPANETQMGNPVIKGIEQHEKD